MSAGEARKLAEGTARKYHILDKLGLPYWHPVFEGCAHVARPHEKADGSVGYVNRRRAYIVDETKQERTFREYRPTPAEIVLPQRVRHMDERARGAVVFHPGIKAKASPNKQWALARWQALVSSPGLRWVQLGEPGVPRLGKCDYVPTASFWEAFAVLSGAMAVVVHEGALHHAAAAFGVPAVVIFGGYISPRVTGYEGQVALYRESPEYPLGCGMRILCGHCEKAMASIAPEEVLEALRSVLEKRRAMAP